MRKIEEVLRLRHELNLDQRQIARSCAISVRTVQEYPKRAEAAPARSCKDTLDEANPNGYRYSRHCELYQRWHKKQDVAMRQQHIPGEKAFIDWAGVAFPIQDRHSNTVRQASLFVAVLGASSYTYSGRTKTPSPSGALRPR
jgi:transposase